jgi:hypothetical protein
MDLEDGVGLELAGGGEAGGEHADARREVLLELHLHIREEVIKCIL